MAMATNDGLEIPLPDQEVAAIAKSVERYRDAHGSHKGVSTPRPREQRGGVLWACTALSLGVRRMLKETSESSRDTRRAGASVT